MSDLCNKPSNVYLFETAFRSFFSVIATHILAGEVDTTLSQRDNTSQLWWLLRYFNPVNLGWRYYSILAYRLMVGKLDEKKLAVINFESYPYEAPIPYAVADQIDGYVVRRLEISGVFSSQGLLSVIAAYQGILSVQFTVSTSGFGFLPNISKPLAMLGLFRVLVSHWIADKVYVEPHAYPPEGEEEKEVEGRVSRLLVALWVGVLVGVVLLSMRSYIPYPPSHVPTHLIDRSIEFLYNYVSVSVLGFHVTFLRYGARGLGNRHLLFDHWLYKLQTIGFMVLLTGTVIVGVIDFVQHDYYRFCA